MSTRTVFLSIAALVCLAAAYRFGSHGIRLQDNKCVGLAVIAAATGLILLRLAFRNRRPKHE